VVDVFDADALREVARAAKPEVVIHQLTDLPDEADPGKIAASLAANARIRIEGTPNLIAAAMAAGARRLIAQSIAFAYAPGPEPRAETDPLLPAVSSVSAHGVHALEDAVTGTPGLDGIVLRYGRLYGPGPGRRWRRGGTAACRRRCPRRRAGAHARSAGHLQHCRGRWRVTISKAREQLGFDPSFRL
jgi:nucleoside-diphosphate-sugar epimerase